MKKGKIEFGIKIGKKVLFAVALAGMLTGAAGCSGKETVLLDSEDLVRLEGIDAGGYALGADSSAALSMASGEGSGIVSGKALENGADGGNGSLREVSDGAWGTGTGPGGHGEGALMAGNGSTGDDRNGVEAATLFVHICGEVMNPGVYELPEGSRVYEAVEEAGGFTQDAAADYVNLAYILEDGWKIEIPSRENWENPEIDGEGKAAGISSGILPGDGQRGIGNKTADSGGNGAGDGLVDINTATKQELITLPGVGESRAESIISYREKNGGFSRIEDIMKVEGIKEGMFAKMKDKICVRGVK